MCMALYLSCTFFSLILPRNGSLLPDHISKMEVIGPWANLCFCYVTKCAKITTILFANKWALMRYLLSK